MNSENAASILTLVAEQISLHLGARRYCDSGPHAGEWRVRIGALYLTDDALCAIDEIGRRGEVVMDENA
ncbi:MAG: hypothetical protein ACRDU5_20010 [Mycobacterium sp.]